MILTGSEIRREVGRRTITIEPFDIDQVNPNSYNYRLGPVLKVFAGLDESNRPRFNEARIPAEGYLLKAGLMYLGHTAEVIGSTDYAMSLIGRSSMGRLGLFLQVSANLGHTTACHQWTLELVATKPLWVLPGMRIGQVSFWRNDGSVDPYDGYYGSFSEPTESAADAPARDRGRR